MKHPKNSAQEKRTISRRSFVASVTSAGAAFSIVPRHVLGGPGYVPPSEQIVAACVGVGAQGTRVMMDFLKEPEVRIAAVCDVNRESSDYVEWGTNEIRNTEREFLEDSSWGSDWKGPTCGREPAKRLVEAYYSGKGRTAGKGICSAFTDFRELFEKISDLDAVIIGTTDHWHAPISIYAMRKGKHVFCQKPMTHAIEEAHRMAMTARETKRATQVAVMNEASEATRQLCEWIWAGAIGPVHAVHNWSSRPFWPQGLERPQESESVPDGLDWNLWLGPAPDRPYSHVYLPFVWRGWYDFGSGAIGDMGNYSFDTIFRVLKLNAPESVEATSTKVFPETFPQASIIHFHFGARADMPPVTVSWYDGGLTPPRPEGIPDDYIMTGENREGLLFVGETGTILAGFNGSRPRLIPEARMKAFQPPPKTLPRSKGAYHEWIDACRGGPAPGANFEFEAPIVETILLGNVALRTQKKLQWDAANRRVKNVPEANSYLDFKYRDAFLNLV
jgi:predicted dehydrogenase